jgi:hypothetical protein
MTRTAVVPDEQDPRSTTPASVGALLPTVAVVRDGLRGYRERRDALLPEAARDDIDRAGHRPRRGQHA